MREGLKLLLVSQSDFDVVGEAKDGREAVRLAMQLIPDVILLNVRHPDLPTSADVQRLTLGGQVAIVFYSLHKNDLPFLCALNVIARFLERNSTAADLFHAIRTAASGLQCLPRGAS
jgi:DNA-binding NarL/FixJ family response regulator